MKEHGLVANYLRREDSLLARTLHLISPLEGETYRNSRLKRVLDFSVAASWWVATLPIQAVARTIIKIEDGGPTTYTDHRFVIHKNGEEGELKLRKLRSMRTDIPEENVPLELRGTEKDPRLTHIGRFLRRTNLDEVPQLLQVMRGELSLIGIRAARRSDLTNSLINSDSYSRWRAAYQQGKPAMIHPQAAIYGSDRKGGDYGHLRQRSDIVYARRASLGLDLYILARAALGIRKRRVRQDKPSDQVIAA